MEKSLLGLALALGTELSAIIIGAYYLAYYIAEEMAWDANLVIAFLIALGLVGWFSHVIYIFHRDPENSDSIPPDSQ